MPYTRRVLESKVAALCGTGNYTFEYDSAEETLHVGVTAFLGWDVVETVRALLDKLVMLNVILDVKAIAFEVISAPVYLGTAEANIMRGGMIPDNAEDVPVITSSIFSGSCHRERRTEII